MNFTQKSYNNCGCQFKTWNSDIFPHVDHWRWLTPRPCLGTRSLSLPLATDMRLGPAMGSHTNTIFLIFCLDFREFLSLNYPVYFIRKHVNIPNIQSVYNNHPKSKHNVHILSFFLALNYTNMTKGRFGHMKLLRNGKKKSLVNIQIF